MNRSPAEPAADLSHETVNSAGVERYLRYDRVNAPYIAWQVDAFRPWLGRRILEVGCGVGSVIAQLPQCELIRGVDVEAEAIEYCRQRFRNRDDCEFGQLDIGGIDRDRLLELQRVQFDTVLSINVIEHVCDDVAALKVMEQVLHPNGILGLLVPAHPRLYGAYDRLDGHFRRYSRQSLRNALRQTSLRILRLRYFNAVGAVGWWVRYRLFRITAHTERDFHVMNRLVPVVRHVERIVPPPFGLSLVAVLQRQ